MTQPHTVAICGSPRDHSYTRLTLEYILAGTSTAGGTTELVDLREYDLPPLDADFNKQDGSVELVHAVDGADAIILETSVYHGLYSGILENALDYRGSDEFGEKTVGLLAIADGSFPVTTPGHLRSAYRSLNLWVPPHQVTIPHVSSSFDGNDLVSEDLCGRVERLGRDAIIYTSIESEPPTFESGENVGVDS